MPKQLADQSLSYHAPLSSEQLARFLYESERALALQFGIVPHLRPFDTLEEPVKQWRIAVAEQVLDRVDARMKHILEGLYKGLMMKREQDH